VHWPAGAQQTTTLEIERELVEKLDPSGVHSWLKADFPRRFRLVFAFLSSSFRYAKHRLQVSCRSWIQTNLTP
jgi:hypothetical protein